MIYSIIEDSSTSLPSFVTPPPYHMIATTTCLDKPPPYSELFSVLDNSCDQTH